MSERAEDERMAALLARLAEAERRAEAAEGERMAALLTRLAEAERRAEVAEAALGEAADVPARLDAVQYSAVLARFSRLVIASPSKASTAERALRPSLAAFLGTDEPLVLEGAPPRESLANAFSGPRQFGQEHELYALATHAVPACITAQARSPGAKTNAEALYGPRAQFEVPEHVTLPLGCEPELHTCVKTPGDPAFAGEVTSLPPATMNEVTTYLTLGMMHSCFRVGPRRGRRFHAAPPVGYALVAMSHCGYLVGAEWVGMVLLYPLSQPFFLGSPEHAAAVRALSTAPLPAEGIVVLSDEDGATWRTYPATGTPLVSWTHTPARGGRFWKVIESAAFDDHPDGGAAGMRALFKVHKAFAAAMDAAGDASGNPRPRALVSACLRYGAYALLVDMPFVGERCAEEHELNGEAHACPVLRAVAAAVAWLSRRGLLYIDLRAVNVRCTTPARAEEEVEAWLVDYDDMLLLSAPARSADELLAALVSDKHGAAALQRWPALEAALRAAW